MYAGQWPRHPEQSGLFRLIVNMVFLSSVKSHVINSELEDDSKAINSSRNSMFLLNVL